MPDIDLTPMNEAAARALFAEDSSDQVLRQMPNLRTEKKAEMRIKLRENALAYWDSGDVDGDTVLRYRELALAATLVNWKDIARQAWKQGYSAGDADAYHGGAYGRQANPYEEQT